VEAPGPRALPGPDSPDRPHLGPPHTDGPGLSLAWWGAGLQLGCACGAPCSGPPAVGSWPGTACLHGPAWPCMELTPALGVAFWPVPPQHHEPAPSHLDPAAASGWGWQDRPCHPGDPLPPSLAGAAAITAPQVGAAPCTQSSSEK